MVFLYSEGLISDHFEHFDFWLFLVVLQKFNIVFEKELLDFLTWFKCSVQCLWTIFLFLPRKTFSKIGPPTLVASCGGTILTEEFILTAAHCICNNFICDPNINNEGVRKRVKMKPGMYDRRLGFLHKTYAPKNIFIHHLYDENSGASSHDLCLLQTNEKMSFSLGKLSPVYLYGSDLSRLFGQHLKVSGWGATSDSECITTAHSESPLQKCQVLCRFSF